MKIEKIDPLILKIKKKNKLTLKQAKFAVEYCKNGGNATQAAKKADYKSVDNALEVQGNQVLSNIKVEKSIAEILTDQGLTKQNLTNFHKTVRDAALEEKDFTNARECNRDFLKIAGVLDKVDQKYQENYFISAEKVDINNVDKLLSKDNG